MILNDTMRVLWYKNDVFFPEKMIMAMIIQYLMLLMKLVLI
jgi:hypothetical protein